MPSNFKYRSGLSSVGAYQVSGVPYLSASSAVIPVSGGTPYKVSFPYITQWIIIENTAINAGLRVAFSDSGARGASRVSDIDEKNYFLLPQALTAPSGSAATTNRVRLDVRVKDLYLLSNNGSNTATAQIAAGLTMVPTEELTGDYNNWTGSSGVG
jgi:hypothetical protein